MVMVSICLRVAGGGRNEGPESRVGGPGKLQLAALGFQSQICPRPLLPRQDPVSSLEKG